MGSDTHVALLRGINVGGRNSLPMAALVAMFSDVGCRDVRSYIQSGNVLFAAPAGVAKRAATTVARAIAEEYGFKVPVILRTAAELGAVVQGTPFPGEEDTTHVVFLADMPERAAVGSLDPSRSPPDEFKVKGREIYLRCPNGYGRSKLTNAYFDAKLGTTSTVRNWRTLLKLIQLAG